MEDLQTTTAKIIYGAFIRLPGEFLCPSIQITDPTTFERRLRDSMQRLSPPTTRHLGQNTSFEKYRSVKACLRSQRVGRHPSLSARKEKVSFQPNEVLDTGQEHSTGSSSRQETTTHSGSRVRFNPKY
ncbi:hypothetical protein NPIL_636741 [Nephila pilipes]|uniref:Uncharacterized protein n=1 Tax=Nephila pilipes TaxID=299642 RepID=A0A8X6P1X5_NEPPI|nr:hypothetical protein NPIL_636711 [Nephila pilipes]GFT43008.1 hypothetical protein NPIL_636741 [Nephila pilipes]